MAKRKQYLQQIPVQIAKEKYQAHQKTKLESQLDQLKTSTTKSLHQKLHM